MIVKVKEERKICFFPPTVAVMKHHCWIRKPHKRYRGLETFVCLSPPKKSNDAISDAPALSKHVRSLNVTFIYSHLAATVVVDQLYSYPLMFAQIIFT